MAVLALARVEAAAGRWVRLVGIIAMAAAVGIGVWSVMGGPGDGGASAGGGSELIGDGAGFAAGGLGWMGGVLAWMTAGAAAVVVAVGPILERHGALLRAAAGVGGVCGMAAACVWSMVSGAGDGWILVLNVIGQVLGSFLMGSVTVAWLLGHAYLTATQMTIAPLRRLSGLFSLAVVLRWVFLAVCFGLMYFGAWEARGAGGAGGLMGKMASLWLVLSLRVAVGLLAVGAFAYMVNDCVKLRSTQSATGILYFASVFVYVGELSSQHLMMELGAAI